MNIQYTITAYDIEKIAEMVCEDFNQGNIESDIEEQVGLYLENTPGVELLDEDESFELIVEIADRVKQSLNLSQSDGKVAAPH